jgi:hypothetical protein
MIFALAAALGLVIAVIRGVPLSTIAEVRFRGLGVLAAAVGLHVLLNPLVAPATFSARIVAPIAPGLPGIGNLLYLASLCCALAFLFLNRQLPGFTVILIGLALNVAVIALNGGQMPGDPTQLERAGLLQPYLADRDAGLWSPFSLVESSTLLSPLADVIFIPMPFREPTVASVGDVVIALGVVVFFNLPATRRTVSRQA